MTTQADICRQSGLQNARLHKWQDWDWKQYQVTITRQNHHISKTESHAGKLAEALREATEALFNETYHDPRTGKTDSPWISSVKAKAKQALAAYEAAQ